MIKNIIFDIGGVIFDDGSKNLEIVLNKSEDETKKIMKIIFSGSFRKCLLGTATINNHIEELKVNYPEFADTIEYVLNPKNYNVTYPLMKDTLELIGNLKDQGYKIYLLSNITEASFNYINETIDFNKYFDGGLFSYQEGIKKPNSEFYERLLDKYNLAKEETIFFDDRSQNIEVGNQLGIKSIKFRTIDDVKNNL